MEARLGLQGTVRLEKWNQIIVRLENSGQPVSGTLGVRVWRGSEMRGDLHVTSFTQPVSLPHRARKRFAFTVPITSISRPVEVFLRRGEEVLQQQRLDLRTALSAEQVILGLTRDLSLDFLATLLPTHTRIVYLPPDELPQHWYGYDSVSAAVLKGVSLQSLSEAQTRALRQWIAGGGTLVVASDSRVALLTEPRLRTLLPVQVLGVEQRDGLPELAAHYGVPMPPAPLIAMQARLTTRGGARRQRGRTVAGAARLRQRPGRVSGGRLRHPALGRLARQPGAVARHAATRRTHRLQPRVRRARAARRAPPGGRNPVAPGPALSLARHAGRAPHRLLRRPRRPLLVHQTASTAPRRGGARPGAAAPGIQRRGLRPVGTAQPAPPGPGV